LTGFAGNGELFETPGGRDFGHPFFPAGGNQSYHMIRLSENQPCHHSPLCNFPATTLVHFNNPIEQGVSFT